MTVDLGSRGIQVTVGGLDFSKQFESFVIGYSNLNQSGLRLIGGTLELVPTLAPNAPPESLDPRKNQARWHRGQLIEIDVRDSTGALTRHRMGYLFILKEPDPLSRKNPKLTIRVGCILNLYSFRQPDDDKSGVQVGQYASSNQLIDSFLAASGIPALVDTVPSGLTYPLPKQGGSYVEQAGKVAYANRYQIWQDGQGQIRASYIDLKPATALLTRTVGVDDAGYDPLPGAETPCQKIVCTGVTYDLKNNYTTFTDVDENYGKASSVNPVYTGTTLLAQIRTTDSQFQGLKRRTITTYQPLGLILPEKFPGSLTLAIAEVAEETYIYEQDDAAKLLRISNTIEKPTGVVLKTWLENTGRELSNPSVLTTASESITDYLYDGRERPNKTIRLTEEPLGAIDTEAATLGIPITPYPSEQQTISWNEGRTDEWTRKEILLQAAIRKDADAIAADATTSEKTALILASRKSSPSNSGQSQPPAVERQSGQWSQIERPIEGVAYLPTSGIAERERTYQVDYATSSIQLAEVARLEGAALIGRRLGQRLTIELDDAWLTDTNPLPRLDYIDGDETLSFLADALTFSHTKTQAVVGADGIWIGTVEPAGVGGAAIIIPPYRETTVIEGGFGFGGEMRVLPYSVAPLEVEFSGGFGFGAEPLDTFSGGFGFGAQLGTGGGGFTGTLAVNTIGNLADNSRLSVYFSEDEPPNFDLAGYPRVDFVSGVDYTDGGTLSLTSFLQTHGPGVYVFMVVSSFFEAWESGSKSLTIVSDPNSAATTGGDVAKDSSRFGNDTTGSNTLIISNGNVPITALFDIYIN